MIATDYIFGSKINPSQPIDEDLIMWLDATQNFNSTTWTDIIDNKQAVINGTAVYDSVNKAIQFNNEVGNYFALPEFNYLTIPQGSDLTFRFHLKFYDVVNNNYGNSIEPGVFRAGATAPNNSTFQFSIFNPQGRARVRVNNTYLFNSSTVGYVFPIGEFLVIDLVWKNGQYIKIYSNAVERYSANTSINVNQFDLRFFSVQFIYTQNLYAAYKEVKVFTKAKTAIEIAADFQS